MTSNTEIILELEMYMQRYRDALGEIANCGDQANSIYLRGVAQAALDGEPTTADKHNVNFKDRTREENINKQDQE